MFSTADLFRRALTHHFVNGVKSRLIECRRAQNGAVERKRVPLEIEAALAQAPWLAGSAFSLADISHVVYVARLDTFQLSGLCDDLPRLRDWLARIRARPSWAEAVEKWGDTSSPARIQHGREAFPKVKALWDAA